eukprot:s361_g10.t1
MTVTSSGVEIHIGQTAQWETLSVSTGNVVEVELLTSSFAVDEEEWAAFLVSEVVLQGDGSLVLAVRLLGSSSAESGRRLKSQLDDGGYLHLCRKEPCDGVEDEHAGYIHVIHIRLWDFAHFIEICGDYMSNAELAEAEKVHRDVLTMRAPPPATPKKPPKRPPRAKEPRKPSKPGAATKRKPPGQDESAPEAGLPRALGEEAKARLKGKLKEIKTKALAGRLKPPDGSGDEDDNAEEEEKETEEGSDSSGESPAPGEGDRLPEVGPLSKMLGFGDRLNSKKKQKKKEVKNPRGTNGTSMKSVKDRLVRKALMLAAEKRDKREEKKKKKSSTKKDKALENLASSLQTLITGKGSKELEAKDKRKKKRKRRTLPDGTIESWSNSSTDSSEAGTAENSESDTDLETPVRKKSRDHPGSILRLLTDHVRETLEQGATTSVTEVGDSVTSGVKVMTYFMLHLRPSFGTYLKEMREMHHIAAVLDTIRKGDISRAADALSARFMALHQSLLDQNWNTARHMEIFPMQETSAVGPSLVLATRKHSRLVDKVAGNYQQGGWPGKGRGKGYKGDWQSANENRADNKGYKGKGKKGKGKSKGKSNWDWNSQNNDWKDSKEKPTEKAA